MSNTIKIKRGTNLSNAGTPAAGELIYKSDTNQLFVGDGSTAATGLSPIGGSASGDIEGVTAGTGLSGGGTSGTVTLNIDLDEVSTVTSIGLNDFIVGVDFQTGNTEKYQLQTIQTQLFSDVSGDITISSNGTAALQVTHDNLSGFVANEHIDHSSVSILGGAGLTGGGTIAASRNIHIGAGTGIDVEADYIAVDVSDFMANGANNRVLTATGTDAFRGEGNLTFDGSTLAVTGAITASSSMTVSGSLIADTLDVAGDITLDADGADVILKDGGTEYGRLTQLLGGLTLKSGSSSANAVIFSTDGDAIFAEDVSISAGKTFTFDSVGLTAVQTSSESFADNNTSLMTSAAINDRIESFGYITTDTNTVTTNIAGTGVSVSSGTGNSTISIGQSVGTSDTVAFGRVNLGSTNNSDYLSGNSLLTADGYIMVQGIVNESETGTAPAAITFGNGATLGSDQISLVTNGSTRVHIGSSGLTTINGTISGTAIKDQDNMSSNSATHLATQQSIKAYVDAEVAGIVNSAPSALNTLDELAAALGDDANFATTTSTSLGNRLRVDTASQGLTGTQQANAITNLGITATKAELNFVDGVTSAIQTQLNGKLTSSSSLNGSNISSGTVAAARIANLAASKITSGTFDAARIAHNSFHLGATSAETGRTVKETGLYTYEVNNASLGTGTETGYYEVLTYGEGTGGSVQIAGQWFSGTYPNLYFRTLRDVNDDWTTWQRLLTTSDEGSGNGLDADTLDGSHASAFLTSSSGLNGSNITSGTIASARLDADTAHLSGTQTFSGAKTFTSSVKADTLVGNSNNTNTLLFNDDQTGASNMTSLQCINHINIMTDGNNNGTGNFRVYNGSYDTDTADLRLEVNSVGNTFVYGDLNVDTNTLYVDSADNRIGIGTPTPYEKLYVQCVDDTSPGIVSNPASTNGAVAYAIGYGDANRDYLCTWGMDHSSGANVFGYGVKPHGSTSEAFINSADNANFTRGALFFDNELKFFNASAQTGTIDTAITMTERFKIDTAGNLTLSGTVDGRDVASDGSKLDGIESGATADQSASEILNLIKTVDGGGSGLDADLLDGVQGSEFLRSNADDSVTGIITFEEAVNMNATDNDERLFFKNNGTTVGDIGSNDTTWLRINQSTNKNIYTPRYIRADNGFFVDGATQGINGSGLIRAANGSASAPGLSFASSTALGFYKNGASQIRFSANNAIRGTWDGDGLDLDAGSLGVNTSANTTNGMIHATNDIVAFSSDKRLKENIRPIENALDKVSKLSGFVYNWNELANEKADYDMDKDYVGVYAQDVEEVQPEAVDLAPFDNDGEDNSISGENYLTVQYEKLVPLLIESIKELKAEIEELKK